MMMIVVVVLLAFLTKQALGAANVDADDKAGPPMPSFLASMGPPTQAIFPIPNATIGPSLIMQIQKCLMDKFEEGKCAKSSFKGFDNPYFVAVLKQYCAQKA